MSLQDRLSRYKSLTTYGERDQYVSELIRELSEFLLKAVPDLSAHGYDIDSLSTTIANPRDHEKYSELLQQTKAAKNISLREKAIEFGVLAKTGSSVVNYIDLLSPFISTDDIEQIIATREESPHWYLNYKTEVIQKDIADCDQWKKDMILIVFGDQTQSSQALSSFYKFYHVQGVVDAQLQAGICDRIRSTLTSNHTHRYVTESVINSLDSSVANKYLAAVCASENIKEGWESIDKVLSKHGYKLWNANAVRSKETIDYINEELLKSDDIDWILHVTKSLGKRYHRAEQYHSSINAAIKKHMHSVDANNLHKEHVSMIDDHQLVEYFLPLCVGETQDRLALNYMPTKEQLNSEDQLNWDFILCHIDLMVKQWFRYTTRRFSIDRMLWFWEHVTDDASRCSLLRSISAKIIAAVESNSETEALITLYTDWLNQHREKLDRKESISFSLWEKSSVEMLLLLWPNLGNKVRDYITQTVNRRLGDFMDDSPNFSAKSKLLEIVCEHNLVLAVYGEEAKISILQYLNNDSFEQLDTIIEKVEKSTASVKYLAKGLANVDSQRISEKGLLTYGKKNIRDAAQWSLALTKSASAKESIIAIFSDKKAKLNDGQKGHLLDNLENLGGKTSSVKSMLDLNKSDLAEYCAAAMTDAMKKKISRIWSPALAETWGDNPEILEYALCILSTNSWGGIPGTVRYCFEQISDIKRRQITTQIIDAWSTGQADKADFWVLDLLQYYSDENTVPILQKLIVSWHKKYRLRAAAVVTAMGNMDTSFALNACDEFYQKSKYSDDVRRAARVALKEAANRRGISLIELYDELVPTFGLEKEGLKLDTGARKFTVKLKSTLDLEVLDEDTGKTFKNLPKAKADEDADLRAMAENQFKLLKKNVKPMVKGLQTRFIEAFEVGQSWPSERWKSLFLEHPILSLVGQGFVWSLSTGENTHYFRISEDLSLIDADDEELSLSEGEIKLMHPSETSAQEREKWKEHFKDYEITSFIAQFDANNLEEIHWEKDSTNLNTFIRKNAEYGKFKRLMEKNNYTVHDGDGSWVASYSRGYLNSPWSIVVELEECRNYMSFDDEVTFGSINFLQNRKEFPIDNVPKRIISSVVSLIEAIMK